MYGCVCDSSWTVGLGDGETQEPEWFGPDCSYRKSHYCYTCMFAAHSPSPSPSLSLTFLSFFLLLLSGLLAGHCPSADNPRTVVVETDCTGVKAKGSLYSGAAGNLCQVDCANQGICDYATGTCQCFDGQYGLDCALIEPTAVYAVWNSGGFQAVN